MKRIALIVDKEGWAFDNCAKAIKKYLDKYYDIDIIPMDMFDENAVKCFILSESYDLMYVLWRGQISWLRGANSIAYMASIGYTYEEYMEKYIWGRTILTGVFDHLYIDKKDIERELTDFVCNNVSGYTVCSEKLNKIYNKLPNIKRPAMVISDGIDTDMFYMKDKTRFDNRTEDDELIVGWCGNSKFIDGEDDDLKGLNKVIRPAIQELQDEGYKIRLDAADRNIKMIPHEKMPDYFNSIDVYICASRTEGHPDPVFESFGCGVPVVATDVGIVPEIFGKKQQEFIIKRNKDDLKKKLIRLMKEPNLLSELSKENLEQSKEWTWEKQAMKYKELFDSFLEKK